MPILLVYLLFVLPWLTDLRVVMGDEAAYADPALRWVDGDGFTSIAWWQSADEFWASNFPLHAWVNAAWVQFTGADTLFGLRLFSLLLYTGGLAAWVFAAKRMGWFPSRWCSSIFMFLFLASLYGSGPSQGIRPESLAPGIFALALAGLSMKTRGVRCALVFLAGLLASLAGIPNILAIGAASLAWLVHQRGRAWGDFLWCGAGGVAGCAFLFLLYQSHGVWDVFVSSTLGLGTNRVAQWQGWRDPMILATAITLGAGLVFRLWPSRLKAAAIWGLVLGLGLPALFFTLSKFPNYYALYALLPLCTATAACLPHLWKEAPTRHDGSILLRARVREVVRFCLPLVLVGAAMLGFPLSALLSWNTMDQRRYAPAEAWVLSRMDGANGVYCDPAAYFAVRRATKNLWTQFALSTLTDEERLTIDTLILWKDSPLDYLQAESVQAKLGGHWKLVDTYDGAERAGLRIQLLAPLGRLSYAAPYRFEAWKRSDSKQSTQTRAVPESRVFHQSPSRTLFIRTRNDC